MVRTSALRKTSIPHEALIKRERAQSPERREFSEAVYSMTPPPCELCPHFSECKSELTACLEFHKYVYQMRYTGENIRSRVIYSTILGDTGPHIMTQFLKIIKIAKKSGHNAIFYHHRKKQLVSYTCDKKRVERLQYNTQLQLLGFYGPEFSEQDIANYLDEQLKDITQWQH